MPGPEDLQVSHLDPGHGLHVTCMHSVTGFEVRDGYNNSIVLD